MDGKLWFPSLIACHAALGTYLTKRPVRFILNKEEDFLYTPKRFSSSIEISSEVDEKGKITSSEIDISVNLGAYKVNDSEILGQIILGTMNSYNFKNLKLRARALKTNIPPQGPFSGFGLAQGIFAIERHISNIADKIRVDPAEYRKELLVTKLLMPLSSQVKNFTLSNELLDTAAKMSDYNRKWSSYELLRLNRREKLSGSLESSNRTFLEKGENPRGIGIAVGFQGNNLLHYGADKGTYSVEVSLTKEGVLEIKSSITSPEDYERIWQKVATDILSLQPEMVKVVSSGAPDSGPSCASRNITVTTKLVEKCCIAIRKQRFHEPLPITVRRIIKPQSGSIRCENFKFMDVTGFFKPGLGAAVVEVSIDLIECVPKIRGIWLAVDGGKVISVHRAKRSLTRSAAQSLGWAFSENIGYENGILPKNQYDNFAIFSSFDTPPIEIEFLSTDTNESKGIGELPFNCIPAAFLQAVSQAMDHSFKSIPLARKDIWEIFRLRNEALSHHHGGQISK